MRFLRSISVAALLVTVACSGDDSGVDSVDDTTETTSSAAASTTSTVATTSLPPPTSAGPTTVPSATSAASPTTTAGSTTTAGPTTTVACEAPTETVDVVENFPEGLSSMYGDDVDTGGHLCFERVVFNFAGDGDRPGFAVQYLPDPLVLASSGEPTELRGDANLVVSVGTWMGEEGRYDGEPQFFPLNVSKIKEVALIDNFEGMMVWGIGLDQERPFKVFVLQDPLRIVVDIATPPEG